MAKFLVKVWARVSPCTVHAEIEVDDEDITIEEQAGLEAIEIAKNIEDWEGKWGSPIFNTKDLDKDSIKVDEIERLDDDEDDDGET